MAGEWQVQRAGLNGAAWQTVCRNPSEAYARSVYRKQLELYSVGRFRLLDPQGVVAEQDSAKPVFS